MKVIERDKDGFARRFSVDSAMPVPALSRPGADAYAVTDAEDPGAMIYALVHRPNVPMRQNVFELLLKLRCQNVVSPLRQGICRIATRHAEVERLVTIMPYPRGGPASDEEGNRNNAINERALRDRIIGEMISGLKELHDHEIAHRAITPSNLFFLSEGGETFVLGECFTSPEGWGLPEAHEPIERALAPAHMRGAGGLADDLFSLGATILSLLTGKPAGALHTKSEPLIEARLSRGSYHALAGDYELQGAMGQLLRGLLDDDPKRRWTLNDVRMWFEGHRPAFRPSGQGWAIDHPVRFAGENYHDRRSLARAMQKNRVDAFRFLRETDYGEWFRKHITAQDYTERAERILRSPPADVASQDDAHLAKVCLHLYPEGPIYYRGMTLHLDGIGAALADYYARDDRGAIDILKEFLQSGLASQMMDLAIEHQTALKRWQIPVHNAMETARQSILGKGMERVLYDLNGSLPCLSPRHEAVYADDTVRLVQAIAENGIKPGFEPLDPHEAAFLAARESAIDPAIQNLSVQDYRPGGRTLALLDLFSKLQRKYGLGPLPALARSFAERLETPLGAMHHKRNRDRLKARLHRIAADGDLGRIASELKLDQALQNDDRAYEQAKTLYYRIERDRELLSRPVSPFEPQAQQLGYQGAAIVGFLASLGAALFMLMGG